MSNVKKKLVILGAGPFAEDIAEIVTDTGLYEVTGFVEGIDRERCKQYLAGLPVYWIDDVREMASSVVGICAVGSSARKKFIEQAIGLGLRFTTIIHPTARVSPSASIGTGSLVSAGSIVAAGTVIGSHVIINRGCLVGHHNRIGDHVTISPGASIAGRTQIGDGSYIGIGATVIDGLNIGKNVVVGAGSVVIRDIRDNVMVAGVPTHLIRELDKPQ